MKLIYRLIICLFFYPSTFSYSTEHSHNQLDEILIDQERIKYWLNKRQIINKHDSKNQQKVKVEAYIEQYRSKHQKNTHERNVGLVKNYQYRNAKNSSLKLNKNNAQALPTSNENYKVNVLAILIDFPDLPYDENRLVEEDTALYYNDYSLNHYQNLLFSDSGFLGPNNQNLISVKQYFSQESGDSFDFSGQVLGWYRAKNNAAYYGGNNDSRNDVNTGELIIEAIEAAVSEGKVNLSDFDQKDPRDIDNDSNYDEPDGEIDHVLIIHSSLGEESGGGVLASNAIWSHRHSISNAQSSIKGSHIKVKNYTIQPIDSAAGIVVHEFGHDLGLDDEYDLKSLDIGSPVGAWSVMSSGVWLGKVKGTQPTSFSPLGRDLLQTRFGGNWVNQQTINADDLSETSLEFILTQASNHDQIPNQIKIELPPNGNSPSNFYYIQLRSNNQLDSGLLARRYEPGMLLWYRNDAFKDNNSSEHPGQGFISVVDADQSFIASGNSHQQIRDAALSLYSQTYYAGDDSLTAINEFNDTLDYSNVVQPQSGTLLPQLGIKIEVLEQDSDSDMATISLTRDKTNMAVDSQSFIFSAPVDTEVNDKKTSVSSGGTNGISLAALFILLALRRYPLNRKL